MRCHVWTSEASCSRQTRAVKSAEPDIRNLPSGENATELTAAVCRLNSRSRRPVGTSHMTTEASEEPETSHKPLCENCSDLTGAA